MFIIWVIENGNYECYKAADEFEASAIIYEVKRDGGQIYTISKQV